MRNLRVIVCDDDEIILDVFHQLFEAMGYDVIVSEGPLTCAFYYDKTTSCPQGQRCTDILITDNRMPGMTGIELLELQHNGGALITTIKKEWKNKILITGMENPELRSRAESLGCHFLSKPVPIPSIMAWVKQCEERVDLDEPLAF